MKKIVFINPCFRLNAKRKYVPVVLTHILMAVAHNKHIQFELIEINFRNISLDDMRVQIEKQVYDIYSFGCNLTSLSIAKEIASDQRKGCMQSNRYLGKVQQVFPQVHL